MGPWFPWLLVIHIVAVISWMAGLLYLFRLFVYHAMETEPVVMERFQVMERRLLRGIANPSMLVAWASGLTMAVAGGFFHDGWFHAKLLLVVLMTGIHMFAAKARKQLIASPRYRSDRFFRIMNEVPTLLMVGIVILVILKPF